ncbi:MAG: hypothetical protein FWG33_04915, partial [Oscillospiraceae bacterium]|nr:hypothetical protein [Oscillospiraceae bacterium]
MTKEFVLKPQNAPKRYTNYREDELRRMTLMQLRDVIESEGIAVPLLNQLDCDELVEKILTFRGSREPLLIGSYSDEGAERLQSFIETAQIQPLPYNHIQVPAKITVFDGIDTNFFDDYRISWQGDLDGTNAFIIDDDENICAVMRCESVTGYECFFLTRLAELPCKKAAVQDYRLLLCPHSVSDVLTRIYNGDDSDIKAKSSVIQAYVIPLLSFEVCIPQVSDMPLAIDFGTTNTTAGMFVSKKFHSQIEKHIRPGRIHCAGVNYLKFLSPKGEIMPVLPTVIGVNKVSGNNVGYLFGFDAQEMSEQGYMDSKLCVFNDIKRWADSYNEDEILTDGNGNQIILPRKEIIRAFLKHIIGTAEQQFKCRFKTLFLSPPVKQHERFTSLYREILDEYELLENEMFDEGIAVLYNIISDFTDQKKFKESQIYQALILDCGGGTTDQSSAAFRIGKGKSAYEINIETAYENGDTDFGGNNLTYRIMQLLKIEAVKQIKGNGCGLSELVAKFPFDLYRAVDDFGCGKIYQELEALYAEAEEVIPTRYGDYVYGANGRDEYYKVYNNFHYLFYLAERVKKEFFGNEQILRIVVSSLRTAATSLNDFDTVYLFAKKWKLSERKSNGELTLVKDFPAVSINTHQVRTVFKADIYDIIRRFFGRIYKDKKLSGYKIVKLTGQSCKIGLFRDALKEYIPGTLIRQKPQSQGTEDNFSLKLTCLEGMIRYLR